MADPIPSVPPSRLGRRTLAYIVASVVVLVVLQAKAPEQLCKLADGFTARLTQVDPWFIHRTFEAHYASIKGQSLANCADSGTRASWPGLITWAMGAAWWTLGDTVAGDGIYSATITHSVL